MANRLVQGGSGAPITGPAYMDQVKGAVDTLYDSIAIRPVSITNVGNSYTIVIDPVLDADVITPMAFFVKPNVANTGAIQMRVTSANSYYPIKKANGTDFAAGEFRTDTDYYLVFLGGNFVCLSNFDFTSLVDVPISTIYTASGTLDLTTIKTIKSPDTLLFVRLWGAGGSGGRGGQAGSGGGGGAYAEGWYRLGDLSNTISIIVGAGGAGLTTNGAGVAGGNSSFGSLVTAYGGAGGGFTNTASTTVPGGGGGDNFANGTSTGPANSGWQGGQGGQGGDQASTPAQSGSNALFGGAGGGGGGQTDRLGGQSKYGGAGGIGRDQGGNLSGIDGTAPGGGGGGSEDQLSGSGARGEVRVYIM